MGTFIVIWFGQLVSMIGTSMTRFALMIWAYQQTGEATTIALLGFFAFLPNILFSPIAGLWVDRLDKRLIMLVTDFVAGMMTLMLLMLYQEDSLLIWHIYVLEVVTGALDVFQLHAFTVATTLLVEKKQYARTAGMRSLAANASRVIAPFMAGFLLAYIDIDGVMWLDVVTFMIAWITLLAVRIPGHVVQDVVNQTKRRFWEEMRWGYTYIREREGLFGIMWVMFGIHVFASLTYMSILPAMILARTGENEFILANVQGALGLGGVVGGILVSIWGGPKKRIHALMGFTAASFLLGDLLFAVGQNEPVWIMAGFLAAVFIPFITTAERVIWQNKVPPEIQGRIFSIRHFFTLLAVPFGFLLAGPLADWLFEPAMMPDGGLAPIFGNITGTGAGAGMGLMFLFTCIGGTVISLVGYLSPAIRNVEADLPDHDLHTNLTISHYDTADAKIDS